MALEVYYPGDIERALMSLALAGQANGPTYFLALQHLGIAFGIRLYPVNTWQLVSDEHQVEELAGRRR